MRYDPYVAQNIGELLDQVGSMMLGAPTFNDKTGYFPQMNIDTEFFALNEGLLAVRKTLGEERYATLRALSDKMRALFESDPEDKTGDTQAGRMLIHEMEDILRSVTRRAPPK
jgi:hypothetical protein